MRGGVQRWMKEEDHALPVWARRSGKAQISGLLFRFQATRAADGIDDKRSALFRPFVILPDRGALW